MSRFYYFLYLFFTLGISLEGFAQKIYYTQNGAVKRANIDGSGIQTVVSSGGDYIAVDGENGYLFYSNTQEIYRANLDGTGAVLIGDFGAFAGYDYMDVFPGNEQIFYTGISDDQNDVWIGGYYDDISDSQTKIDLPGIPNDEYSHIAYNEFNDKLYFSDYNGDVIYETDLSGNWNSIITSNAYGPLAIDYINNALYWVKVTSLNYEIIKLNLSNLTSSIVKTSSTNEILGIEVYPKINAVFFCQSDGIYKMALDGTGLSKIISGTNISNVSVAVDVISPTFTSLTPANNSTGVLQSTSSIALTFDESVKISSSVGSGNNIKVRLFESVGSVLVQTIDRSALSISGATVTISGLNTLKYNTKYHVLIGSQVISDLFFNDFFGIGSSTGWTFTTESCPIIPAPSTPSPASYCSGDATVAISVASPGVGKKINWYDDATAGSLASGSKGGTNDEQFTPSTGGTYYAEAYDVASPVCVSSTRTAVTLTVNPLPTVVNQTPSVCETAVGSAAGIDLTSYESAITGGAAGISVAWYTNAALTASVSTPTSVTVSNGSIFYAKVFNSTTLCFNPATVTFTTKPSPTVNNQTPSMCETTAGSGTVTGINLTTFESAITGGATGVTVTWFSNATLSSAVGTPTSVTASNGTIFYAKVSDNTTLCYSKATVTFTINPLPAITNQVPTICETTIGSGTATSVNLITYESAITGGAAGVTVTWFSNSALSSAVGTPTSVTVSNGTIFYAKVSNNTTLCFSKATVTFTISPLPTVSNQTPSMCETTAGSGTATGINLTTYESAITGGATGVTVTWFTNVGLSSPVGTPTSVLASNGTIFYAKVSNNTTLCFSKATVTFTIRPLPTVTNQTPSMCEGTAGSGTVTGINLITFESAITGGATGVTVTWFSDATLSSAVGTPTSVTASNGTVFYAKVSDNTTLCYSKATVTFTVNPLPITSITGSTTVCANSTNISYQASGSATTYTWTVPSGTTITSGQGTNTIIVTFGSTSGAVQVIPSNGVGCVGPSATPFNVTATTLTAPVNPVGASYCVGSATNAISVSDPGAGKKIDWFTAATGALKALGSLGGTNGEVFTPTAAGTFYAETYAVGIPGCVSLTRTAVTLTGNPPPSASSQTDTFCESTAGSGIATGINLTSYTTAIINGASGVSVTWYSDVALSKPVSTPTSVSASNGAIFYAKVTNGATLCSTSTTVTFTINPLPVTTITSGSATVCANATSVPYQASNGAATYTWVVPSGAIITSGQGTNSILVTFGTSSGAVKVTPSNGGSCIGTAATYNVTVGAPLNAYAVRGGGNFCTNGNGLLLGMSNSDAGIKYELFRANITTGLTVTSNGGAFDFPSAITQPGTYTVKATNAVNCQAPMNGTAIVTQLNAPSGTGIISGKASACSGATETYTVSGISTATDFQWSLPDGITKISQAGTGITVETNTSGSISVVGSNECGTGGSASYMIKVSQSPTVSITLPTRAFVNDPVEFSLSTSTTTPTISWNFGDGNTASIENPSNTYASGGDFNVSVGITDNAGCKGSDSKTLRVIEDPGLTDDCIKNVVTANGDNKNDFLYIDRIEKYPNNEVILIDRWGVEVFKTNGYNNSWDLKKGGEYLPAGNYICVVKFGDTGRVIKRTISVIKGR